LKNLVILHHILIKTIYILFSFWLLCFFAIPVSANSCAKASTVSNACCKKNNSKAIKNCCNKSKSNSKTCKGKCCQSACHCSSSNIVIALQFLNEVEQVIYLPTGDELKYYPSSIQPLSGFTFLWTLPKIG
ncbi:MAG: hypothetical protein ACOVMI_00425, partial [Chitinophagaceae bacterium]